MFSSITELRENKLDLKTEDAPYDNDEERIQEIKETLR